MKKNISKIIMASVIIFSFLLAYIQPEEVYAATLPFNKQIQSHVKEDQEKEYNFKVKTKQKIEISFQCKNLENLTSQPNIDISLYKIKGFKDSEAEAWLDKHYYDDDLYYKYEFDPTDTYIDSISTYYEDDVKEWKLTKTLAPGKYYVSIENKGWKNIHYKLKLTNYLSNPKSIKLNLTSISLRYKKTKQLKVTDKNGISIDNSVVKYSSSNTKVATVSKSGKITAKNPGKCKITAKIKNGKKATCKVTVPKLNLPEQLQTKPVYATFLNMSGYSTCNVKITNNSKKDIIYAELQIASYKNSFGRLHNHISLYYVNYNTIPKKSSKNFGFDVNSNTKYAKVCIKKVCYEDGKEWVNPLYNRWVKKYM